jgi:hypothetical protein
MSNDTGRYCVHLVFVRLLPRHSCPQLLEQVQQTRRILSLVAANLIFCHGRFDIEGDLGLG